MQELPNSFIFFVLFCQKTWTNGKKSKDLNIPGSMSKPTNPERCQNIYMNLLQLPFSEKLPRSDTYMRELFQCHRCDATGLNEMLGAYTDFMGKETTERILNRKASEEDFLAAEDAVVHYQKWTRECLVDELSSWNRCKYHGYVWRTELLATFGISASIGMWKGVAPRIPSFVKNKITTKE